MITFSEFGLSSEILKAIEEIGYEAPTSIQEKAVPFLLENRSDLIALAQTGTGKTAAYGLPLIERIKAGNKNPQAIVLSPTRELCTQIANDLECFSKYCKNVSVVAVYGGARIETQISKLKKGAQIVVATPGRMNDIIRRKKIRLSEVTTVVLDEADEMLNMGFQEELNFILEQIPTSKNILLFSATMPKSVVAIASKYTQNAYEITIGEKNIGANNIHHVYYTVQSRDRYLALKRVADVNPNIYGIIFCRTRMETKEIAEKLIQDGYNADALHGDLSQTQRDFVMNKFRKKNLQMLVATDVAARGLDVEQLSHIINYNLPEELEVYTHRSGRTGRAGKSGVSIAIITPKELHKIKRIEKLIQKKFEFLPVPSGAEICRKQFFALIDKVKKVSVNEEQIAPFIGKVYEKLEMFSREDIIKHFVALEFNILLDYYKKERDLNVSPKKKKKAKFHRLFINVGLKHGVRPRNIIGLVNEVSGRNNIAVGAIDVMNTFSFFEIPESEVKKLTHSKKKIRFGGRAVKIEDATSRPKHKKVSSKKSFGPNSKSKKRKHK